jgi:prevent-host-death family protein
MGNVPATEFKAKCLELMDRVSERRETFVITKRGKPVAKLVPVDPQPKESLFGWLRGAAEETGDLLDAAVPPASWDAVAERDRVPPSSGRRRRPRSRRGGRKRS